MSEHEEELRKLFEQNSVKPGFDINPRKFRLMSFEGFKAVVDEMMKKAEYFGQTETNFPPHRA